MYAGLQMLDITNNLMMQQIGNVIFDFLVSYIVQHTHKMNVLVFKMMLDPSMLDVLSM